MSVTSEFHKDIMKKKRSSIWAPFIRAIKTFHLIEDGDRIAVALSGGKDSFLLARLLSELTRHPLKRFEVELIAMDPGYSERNIEQLKETARALELPIHIEKKRIFDVLEHKAPDNPCYLCSRMRRGALYSLAEDYDCNKLALGHHHDDVVETTLLNLFFSGTFKTMLPKISADHFEGIELIRPLFFIKERDILNLYRRYSLSTLDCACEVASGAKPSKRDDIKALIEQLKKEHGDIDKSIFRAASNVNLDYVIGWEKDGKRYRFDD